MRTQTHRTLTRNHQGLEIKTGERVLLGTLIGRREYIGTVIGITPSDDIAVIDSADLVHIYSARELSGFTADGYDWIVS